MILVFDCMFMIQHYVIYLMYDKFHVCSLLKIPLITHEYFNIYAYSEVMFYFIIIRISCYCFFKVEVFFMLLMFEHVLYIFLHEKYNFCMNFSMSIVNVSTQCPHRLAQMSSFKKNILDNMCRPTDAWGQPKTSNYKFWKICFSRGRLPSRMGRPIQI